MSKIIPIHIGETGIRLGERFWEHLIHLNQQWGHDELLSRFGSVNNHQYFPYGIYVDTGYHGRWPGYFPNEDGFYRKSNLLEEHAFTRSGDTTGSYAYGFSGGGNLLDSVQLLLWRIEDEHRYNQEIEGFVLFMSAAGGTGSGVGAALLEQLKKRYPQKKVVSIVVYDSATESRAPLTYIYNQLFLTQKLAECSDATIVLDNHAIAKKAESAFRSAVPNYTHWNLILERVVFRIMGHFFSERDTVTGFVDAFVRKPGCSFLTAAFTPILGTGQDPVYARTVQGMVERAYSFSDLLVDIGRKVDRLEDTFLSFSQAVGGNDSARLSASYIMSMLAGKMINALKGMALGSELPFYKRAGSTLQELPYDVTLLMNSPSIFKDFLVHRILDPFDRLYARKAFVHHTESYLINEPYFLEAREKLGFLVQDYETEIETVNQMIVDFRDRR
ncbi:MAG: hypothetical protein AAF998_11300 [Bacteroidota bacterium]